LNGTLLMSPLKYNELRFTTDDRNESLGKKIREAVSFKVPVLIIVGPKDKDANSVSIRHKDKEEQVSLTELSEYLSDLGNA